MPITKFGFIYRNNVLRNQSPKNTPASTDGEGKGLLKVLKQTSGRGERVPCTVLLCIRTPLVSHINQSTNPKIPNAPWNKEKLTKDWLNRLKDHWKLFSERPEPKGKAVAGEQMQNSAFPCESHLLL